MAEAKTTRWSDAEWAEELQTILLIGCGGIGSHLAYSLSRISHELYLIDPDVVEELNISGGQMFRNSDVGAFKVDAMSSVCREFGCTNSITSMPTLFTENTGMTDVCIVATDNMASRREAFDVWCRRIDGYKGDRVKECLFIDGRLLLENMEILCVQGNNKEQMKKYRAEYLFADEEVADLPCTAKQTTFSAMVIAGMMTATLCNWLTNKKLEIEFREVPFYQRLYLPIFENKQINIEQHAKEEAISI